VPVALSHAADAMEQLKENWCILGLNMEEPYCILTISDLTKMYTTPLSANCLWKTIGLTILQISQELTLTPMVIL